MKESFFFNAQLKNFLHLFCVFQVNLGKREARVTESRQQRISMDERKELSNFLGASPFPFSNYRSSWMLNKFSLSYHRIWLENSMKNIFVVL